jgi:hypothetical protein
MLHCLAYLSIWYLYLDPTINKASECDFPSLGGFDIILGALLSLVSSSLKTV